MMYMVVIWIREPDLEQNARYSAINDFLKISCK